MALVVLVEVDDHGRHPLERTRARERTGVERAARDHLGGELEREPLGAGVVAADECVLVRAAVRELPGGERVETGDDRRSDELLRPLRERAWIAAGKRAYGREAQLARDAEERRPAEHVREGGRGGERRVGLRCEDDEIGVADGVLIRGSRRADFARLLPCPLGVARADHDLVTRLDEPGGECEPEGAGAAEDGDPHAGTAPKATSASRRRASPSLMRVRVTSGLTSPRPSRSPASASSTTSASIKPG